MFELTPNLSPAAIRSAVARLQTEPVAGDDPERGIDRLVKQRLLTARDAQLLRPLVGQAHAEGRPPAATVVKEAEAMMNGRGVQSLLAVAILSAIRCAAQAQVDAEASGRPGEGPAGRVPGVDWGDAAELAVEGGGLGAIAGAEVGGPWGSTVGAVIGALIGGLGSAATSRTRG